MEKDKAYYFRFSPQKWLSAVSKVQLLNHEEKGIYWDLCCMIFCEKGKINYDDLLCRKMRIEKAKLTNCLNLLFDLNLLVLENGYLSSKYMSEELEIIKEMSQKRRVSGAAGGRPKKQTKASLSDKDNDKDNDKDKKEDKEKGCVFPLADFSMLKKELHEKWKSYLMVYLATYKTPTVPAQELLLADLLRVPENKRAQALDNAIKGQWKNIYAPKDDVELSARNRENVLTKLATTEELSEGF